MTLGQLIKELREKNGMFQRELSHQLSVGDAYLSKVERNKKILKREHLKVISEIFNEPIENLETLWLANVAAQATWAQATTYNHLPANTV